MGCVSGVRVRIGKFEEGGVLRLVMDRLGKVAAAAAAALFFFYLLSQLIKGLGRDVPVYRCPRCNALVRQHQEKCHVCGVRFRWSNPEADGEEGEELPKLAARLVGRAWWAGFIALMFSMCMLCVCTLKGINAEVWEDAFFFSLGYVVGPVTGAMAAR